MNIKFVFAVLALGFALNASATNNHHSNVWNIPVVKNQSQHFVIGLPPINLTHFFEKKTDILESILSHKKIELDLVFSNIKGILEKIKIGNFDWDKFCEQPGPGTGPGPVSPVPEPETYAMMLAGLGLMGFIARRRKKTSM